MKKNKKLNCLIIILSISLVSSLTLGINKNNKLLASNLNDYDTWNEEHNNTIEDSNEMIDTSIFYKKVSEKSNINSIILSDDVLLKTTSDDEKSFDKSLGNMLKNQYSINSTFKLIENKGSTILDGNNLFDADTSITDFDLAIVSFGTNDYNSNTPIEEFAQNYTNLLCKIRNRNYEATIIVMLPPSLPKDNIYSEKIKYICELSNIDYIDLSNEFSTSKYPLTDLIENNVPTSLGYDLITYSINSLIVKNN